MSEVWGGLFTRSDGYRILIDFAPDKRKNNTNVKMRVLFLFVAHHRNKIRWCQGMVDRIALDTTRLEFDPILIWWDEVAGQIAPLSSLSLSHPLSLSLSLSLETAVPEAWLG